MHYSSMKRGNSRTCLQGGELPRFTKLLEVLDQFNGRTVEEYRLNWRRHSKDSITVELWHTHILTKLCNSFIYGAGEQSVK